MVDQANAKPSAASMKMRFPEFAGLDDHEVEFAVEEAGRSIDSTWIAGDRIIAWTYLAAHFLASGQVAAENSGREASSETIGRISVSYATGGFGQRQSMLAETSYGRRYIYFARRSHPAAITI